MVEPVEQLLTAWGLGHLAAVFAEQEITEELLFEIDGSLLKELIPTVGQRMKFSAKRNEYLANKSDQEALTATPSPSGASSSSPSAACQTFSSATSSNPVSSGSNCSASLPATSSTVSAASKSAADNAFTRKVAAKFCLNKFIADMNFESILKKHVLGESALTFYEVNLFLSGTARTAIVDALMSHLYVHARDFGCTDSIKNDHCLLLAERIALQFQGEKKETYYVAPAKGCISLGKLPVKLRNLRRKAQTRVVQRQSVLTEESVDDPAETIRSAPQDASVDVDGAISFLAYNTTPWPEVERNWALTLQHRLKTFKDQPYLEQYFQSWPILKSPSACTLLEADFNSMWPGRELVIYTKWPLFEKKLFTLAKSDVKDVHSQRILSLNKPNITADARAAIAFSLLPAIIPPSCRLKTANGKTWVPSIAEARSSMILHVQVAANIRKQLRDYTARIFEQGQRVQPLIVVVGPTLDKITKSYVVVDKVLWPSSCLMKAIDTCFKVFFATQSEYPAQSKYLWEAIQKSIYNIRYSKDKSSSPLDSLV